MTILLPTTLVPQSERLEVYARVTQSLAVTDRQPGWMRHDRGVPAPLAFLEGPVLDGAGGLYMVDVAWGRILYVDRYGEFRVVVEYDGEPNGLALAGPDRLLVADYQRGLVEIADLRGEPRVGVVVHEVDGAAFHGLNDLVVTSDGTVYVTDQGDSGLDDPYGRLLRVRLPAGGENATEEGNATQVAVEVVLEGIPSPNGLVWDEKSATVFVAVTRDNAIWRVPLVESVPHRVGRYLQLSGGLGPDGMAAGPQGTLLVAHLGLGVVWVFDPTGTAVMALHSPTGRAVTNLCVTDNGRVFVTESETSTVLTADLSRLLDHDFPRRNLS